ncbi:hypothetical protein BRETT_000001, partial [Brettanomyces bruxellensis]
MSDEKEAIVERRIRPLDKTVVNRIAAGEVIIAPSNALKEILENSIDAKSTAIEISIKDGGLKLLQITDDGSGINKDDLPLLCERFATSKLTKFEDLQSISTYGFRGEALASISHISHLSVVTKTSSDECAWKCYYLDGKLAPPPTGGSSEPRAVAGRDGTSIIVEDLFYNVPSRLRTLRSQSEEYARIVEVTSSYAIHTLNVGFSCKKQGTNKMDLVIRSSMSQKTESEAFMVQAEVRFLNEEEIIGRITSAIEEKLSSLDTSRTFLTQQVISTSQQVKEKQTHKLELQQPEIEVKKPKLRSVSSIKAFKRPYEKDMVRTDFNQSTLSSFVSSTYDSDKSNVGESSFTVEPTGNSEEGNVDSISPREERNANREEISHITPTIVNLDSIKALRKEVKEEANAELTELFSKHTYVGVADYSKRLMCLQYDVRLYLMDYASVCNEFFYQVGLSDFSNFGRIRFTNPVDIRELLKTEIYDNAELMEKYYQDAPKLDDLINTVFIEMSEMLNEYFSIEIDKTNKEYPKLKTLPMLMQNYIPSFNKLSLFLFKIGTKVNWENEQDCLGGVLRQLALFYIPEPLDNDDPNEKEDREKTSYTLENIIFPSIKKRFIATENLVRM